MILTTDSPRNPQDMAWDEHYPRFKEQGKKVEVVDVGCGFGGLLFALAPQMPDTLILGMICSVSSRSWLVC